MAKQKKHANKIETKKIIDDKKENSFEQDEKKNEEKLKIKKVSKSDDKNKKDKKNIIKTILIIIGIIALCALVFFASTKRESKELITYVEDTTAEQYFALKNGDERVVVLLASPSCYYCQLYKPVINKVSADYELPVYYVNTSELSVDDYNKIYNSSPSISSGGQGVIPTPTTLIVQNGEEIDVISGYVEYNKVVTVLQKNGVIE